VKINRGDFLGRQAGFHPAIKAYLSQVQWTMLQVSLFLVFMISGAYFAGAA